MRKPKTHKTISLWKRAAIRRASWWLICQESHVTEFSCGAVAAGWTFLLLCPTDLFATNKSFLGLAAIGSEHSWAIFSGSLAFCSFLGLIFAPPWFRFCSMTGGAFFWWFLASHIAQTAPRWHGVPVNTGFVAYGVAMISCAICVFMLAGHVISDFSGAIGWYRYRQGEAKVAIPARASPE